MLKFAELRAKLPQIMGPPGEFVWDRYVDLCEGEKYTFGDTFTSREDYGKFIFWSDPAVPQISPVCKIISKNGSFWMTPLGRNPIFLNNVKSKGRTKLQHGDELSLKIVEEGQNSECPPGSLKFMVPKFNGGQPELKFNGVFTPGQNPLILSYIFSHLDLNDLKVARLVAPEWNKEAIRYIKKHAVAEFHLSNKEADPLPIDLNQFSRYARDMENFPPLENWSMIFPAFAINTGNVNSVDGEPVPRHVADLDKFLADSHKIKKLKLGGVIRSPFDYEVRLKVIQKLAGSLQHLELSGRWFVDASAGNYSASSLTSDLTKLEVFSARMQIMGPSMQEHYHNSRIWLQPLISSMKSLRALHLKSVPIQISVTFLENLHNFPHLEEIELHHITGKLLNLLLQGFDKPLKKLVLDRTLNIDPASIILYQKLLEKHCKTLERLELTLPNKIKEPKRLAMPVFPSLKVLEVTWMQDTGLIWYHDGPRADNNYGVFLTFPGGGNQYVNYAHNFPSLRSLTLLPPPNRVDQVRACSEMFFPVEPGPQVCETLVHLEIPIQLHVPRIVGMVPNVGRVQEARVLLEPIFHLQKEMMGLV